jgi:uncharacterized protein (TIGR03382 family)
MRTPALASILVASAALAGPAAAHIAMTSPAPRTTDQKTGPCGAAGSTRGGSPTTYEAGQTITVEWDETVDHPGHYRVAFDEDGNDFMNPSVSTDAFPSTLVDQITDRTGGHYTQEITLPDLTCDTCTLQLIQVMQINEPYNSFYFQCADLVLTPASGGDDDGGTATGGCSAGGSNAGGAFAFGLALALATRRRRQG